MKTGRTLAGLAATAAAALLGLGLGGTAAGQAAADGNAADRPGGDTTVHATGKNAFSFPAANLPDAERTRFVIGNSFFKRNWVEAGASTTARDGLGPHFIARSCGACHALDGRGAPPAIRNRLNTEQPVSLLLRLSIPGPADPHAGVRPDPVYGDQLDNAAVQGVRPEGEVVIRETLVQGRFADGTPYTLRKPGYSLRKLGYGPTHPQLMLSPRVAPQLIGLGLLEAIPESEILANARTQAEAPGPIKGVPNRVWDVVARDVRVGRFGWKANAASLGHQTAAAFAADMGITSSLVPQEGCTPAQKDCLAAPRGRGEGNGHDIDDRTFEDVVFYSATIAPPARRNAQDAQVLRGQQLFAQAQCAVCHRPSYVTAQGPFPRLTSAALSRQQVFPYTDLLLHDMGEGLADGRPDFQANGRQWKTPPLWGLGLIREVNGHQRLLHDGRADGVLEAVLWHGGEAQASRDQVLEMSRADREALVRFVESL
ncbi:di-heme oxidoreductase family protein [Ramlibacter tataouinensis]|uniref:Thiol oxidoreductase-like protein n=1 Tax=Ramlibacter tataouinensis (strain ATCC BAA-407 / DSM 14655 / LMG 21543 / TTB310) TaxID=365046 RepID=F5Y1U2_RAMTT|nr:di-heme oxidoredictase family protein [Ramlibacter tataouinensis]AEG93526.1 thiol oxidoreductase-like protein [Ramlibacter tataouinensis TTB310]